MNFEQEKVESKEKEKMKETYLDIDEESDIEEETNVLQKRMNKILEAVKTRNQNKNAVSTNFKYFIKK